jgi:pimeloyl-ACP methyl ester carboxylesterase
MVLAGLLVQSQACVAASNSDPAPEAPAVTLTDEERTAIESELQALDARLADLRKDPAVTPDLWADVHLFIKGIKWAVDFGPVQNEQDREVLQAGLQKARERLEQLAAGRPTWAVRQGSVVRGFVSEIDGSTQPYGLVIPPSYDSSKPIRLDVVLHGSMRTSGIAELKFALARDANQPGRTPAVDADYIELHPLGRLGENAYRFEGETDVDEAIAAVCRNYRIDQGRIVLRGSSLGGVGAWQLGLKRPDRFVALGPTAGPVDTYEFANSPWKHFVRLEPLPPWQQKMLHLVDAIDYAANAGMVPVVAVMGDQDAYYSSHLLMKKPTTARDMEFRRRCGRHNSVAWQTMPSSRSTRTPS